MHLPVLAYRCLVKEDDREAPSFLFESVEPGFRTSQVGRYSVVGSDPSMEVFAKENNVTIVDHEKGSSTEKVVDDPLEIPRSLSDGWKPSRYVLREGRVDDAFDVLEEFRKKDTFMNEKTYKSLLNGLHYAG